VDGALAREKKGGGTMRTTLLSRPLNLALTSALVCLCAIVPVRGQSFDWRLEAPERQRLSKEKLDALAKVLAARNTKSLLVIRNDKIVYEWYADGHSAAKPHSTASLAKALVAGLSLSVAVTDGKMTLDDRAAKFIAPWSGDQRKSKITVRQLGSHTSGLADAESNNEKWDAGPVESSSFPTKWMSGDGKTLFLVFSGDDNFAVRKGRLSLTEQK
jgi:CubicO group peptidase (beta-lactamase class C family)